MIFLIFSLCEIIEKSFDDTVPQMKVDLSSGNKYIFKAIPTFPEGESVSFFAILARGLIDTIKESVQPNPDPNTDSDWSVLEEREWNNIIYNRGPLTLMVIASTDSNIRFRGGYTNPNLCPDGTYITFQTNYDISTYITPATTYPHTFCTIFMHWFSSSTFTNRLVGQNTLKYLDTNGFRTAVNNEEVSLSIRTFPLYLIAQLYERKSLVFVVNNAAPGDRASVPTVTEDETKPIIRLPDQTPSQSPDPSPSQSPDPSPSKSPDQTPSPSPDQTPSPSPDQTPRRTPRKSIHPGTPKPTPDQTWDGKWLDPTNVIIRGEEIPEIQETYPPLQTAYIKTEVPKIKKIVTFGAGTIAIICVIVMTIFNGIRTYHRLNELKNEYEGSDPDWDLSSTFYSYESYSYSYSD